MQTIREFNDTHDFILAGHRGDSANAPENTMSAFESAIKVGADMIETDIYLTADKQIVLHHNSTIMTPNGKQPIGALTLSQLKKIDIGSSFSPEFSGERIPEFSEFLLLIKGRAYLNLEIKPQNGINPTEYIDLIVNKIEDAGVADQVMLASYFYDMLAEIQVRYPNYPTAGIYIPHIPLMPHELLAKYGISAFICSLSSLNKEISDDIKACNLVLGAYSIDNEKHFAKAMRYGVKALGSNCPAKIAELLRNRTSQSTASK